MAGGREAAVVMRGWARHRRCAGCLGGGVVTATPRPFGVVSLERIARDKETVRSFVRSFVCSFVRWIDRERLGGRRLSGATQRRGMLV